MAGTERIFARNLLHYTMVTRKYTLKKLPHETLHVVDHGDFKINYKNELNTAQYDAVTSSIGPHLVIAGAGTGKTRTIVYRVSYLIENGVAPEKILLLTFTRKAAREMLSRASQLLDSRCDHVAGGTFHTRMGTDPLLAIQGFCQDPANRRFTHPTGTGKQKRMVQTVVIQRIDQCP